MPLELGGSVGASGSNASRDVLAVKRRLTELGFGFFPQNASADPGLIVAIRLFQSILSGRNVVGSIDGRIDPGGATERFLNAGNAPRWRTMPLEGVGFVNHEAQQTNDHHDFGTSWLAETLIGAGQKYHDDFRKAKPGAAPLAINDVSLPKGGDTPQHVGHETGLACDIRLPRKDGQSGGIGNPNTNSDYDRVAMRAQLKAIRAQPLFSRALFNDRTLINEGLCQSASGHNDHAHIEVKPPMPGRPSRRREG
jgi:hypothetical protein